MRLSGGAESRSPKARKHRFAQPAAKRANLLTRRRPSSDKRYKASPARPVCLRSAQTIYHGVGIAHDSRSAARAASGRTREWIDGAGDADAQQQELFVLVAARLADGQARRNRVRRDPRAPRRCGCACGDPAAFAFDPGAVPDLRGGQALGHPRHRRVRKRGQAKKTICCPRIALGAPTPARSQARCIRASFRCARRCR